MDTMHSDPSKEMTLVFTRELPQEVRYDLIVKDDTLYLALTYRHNTGYMLELATWRINQDREVDARCIVIHDEPPILVSIDPYEDEPTVYVYNEGIVGRCVFKDDHVFHDDVTIAADPQHAGSYPVVMKPARDTLYVLYRQDAEVAPSAFIACIPKDESFRCNLDTPTVTYRALIVDVSYAEVGHRAIDLALSDGDAREIYYLERIPTEQNRLLIFKPNDEWSTRSVISDEHERAYARKIVVCGENVCVIGSEAQDDGSMCLIVTIVPPEIDSLYSRKFEATEAFDVLDAIYHPGTRQVYALVHFKRGGWRLYWYDIDKDGEGYYDASEFNYEDHAVPMRIYPFSKGIVAVFEVDDGNKSWLKIGSL